MQDYIDFAAKNGVLLKDAGPCQFCGANTERGIHECLEIFNLGFQTIDFSDSDNHIYRFLIVDAHCLQHPEIHGRWSNHFHLTRLHLIFEYDFKWTYSTSPQLSKHLNQYKVSRPDEVLISPACLERGAITTTDVLSAAANGEELKDAIRKWAAEVYDKWKISHGIVDFIAKGFLE